jgi:sugar phosphate isomerase/epimerase
LDVAVRDMLLEARSTDELCQKVKTLGLNTFELWIERNLTTPWKEVLAGKEQFREFAKKIRSSGLKVCAGIVATHLANENIQPEIDYAINAARILSLMGVKTLRIDVVANEPGKKEQPWQEYLDRAIRSVKKCIERTKDIETEFAVENHGLISNRPEFLKGLFAEVDSPRLGLCLDTGNFYWYGHPLPKVYEIIEEFAHYTKHTHIKNINYPFEISGKIRSPGYEYEKYVSPLKEGNIDLSKIVAILKKEKFTGSLCVEDESLRKFPENKRMQILKEDTDFVKSLI